MSDEQIFIYMNPWEDDELVECDEPDASTEEEYTTIMENEDE